MKKRGEQLIPEIDKGKIALTVNRDLLRTSIENGGKIFSTIS